MKTIETETLGQTDEPHIPNFMITPAEASGIRCRKIKFFPEDIEKMNGMTEAEMLKYKAMLKKNHKYYH